jgi:hypothetical protein
VHTAKPNLANLWLPFVATISTNGTVTITNSTLSANTTAAGDGFAGEGGANSNSSVLRIVNSTLFQNAARLGGGIANLECVRVNIANSILSSNSANFGAGISNTSGGQVIANSSAIVRNVSALRRRHR